MKSSTLFKLSSFIAFISLISVFQNCTKFEAEQIAEISSTKTDNDSSQANKELKPNDCPSNYLYVPENKSLNTSALCVSKYEMAVSNMAVESKLSATPKQEVSWLDAINYCESLGSNYSLISSTEWQAILNEIYANPLNYRNAVIDNNTMNINTGLTNSNAPQITFPESEALSVWSENRRFHFINNKQSIWDIGGNLSEWLIDDKFQLAGLNFASANRNLTNKVTRFYPTGNSTDGFRCIYKFNNPRIASQKLKLSCKIGNQNIPNGSTGLAYQEPTAASLEACMAEERVCTNGVLSGQARFDSCKVVPVKSCLFRDTIVPHMREVSAFDIERETSNQKCMSNMYRCLDGNFYSSLDVNKTSPVNMNLKYKSCIPKEVVVNCSFAGKTIADGQLVQGFNKANVILPERCKPINMLCKTGTLVDPVTNASILDAQSLVASCTEQKLDPVMCTYNGTKYIEGEIVKVFAEKLLSPPNKCVGISFVCSGGVFKTLDGLSKKIDSYFPTCIDKEPSLACSFGGLTIPDKQYVLAYKDSFVKAPDECKPEPLYCQNGNLVGNDGKFATENNYFKSCTQIKNEALSCAFRSSVYPSGSKFNAYLNPIVFVPNTCNPITLSCKDGKYYSETGLEVNPVLLYDTCVYQKPIPIPTPEPVPLPLPPPEVSPIPGPEPTPKPPKEPIVRGPIP